MCDVNSCTAIVHDLSTRTTLSISLVVATRDEVMLVIYLFECDAGIECNCSEMVGIIVAARFQ